MNQLSNQRTHRSAGFTLIEIAMVLLILSLVLGGLISAIGQSTENTRRSEARALISQVEDALYGFAQVTGRLPCPASNTSNGLESVSDVDKGLCNLTGHGFVPAGTLGLRGRINADGLLLDPWMNPLRYSVSTLAMPDGNRAFTSAAGMQSLFAEPGFLGAGSALRVCNAAGCPNAASVLTDPVPAVVISMGPNWAAFTSADEVDNAGNVTLGVYRLTNTTTFVSRDYNPDAYDDIITWMSPHVLFSRQVMAGRLP